MQKNEIRQALVPIFQRYTACTEQELLAGGPLEHLVDSMTFLEIVFDIEERFGITIQDDEMKEIRTVEDVVEGIEVLLTRKP